MIFPKNIIGPKFDDGDLVSFTFDDAELTLRIPVIPINRGNVSDISPIKDFRDIKTSNWNTDDQNHPSNLLSLQHWCVEDANTLDNIAFCRLFVELVEATEFHQEKNSFLQSEQFKKIMLEWQTFTFKRYEEKKYLQDSNWPTSANNFFCRAEPKQHLNWLIMQLKIDERLKPIELVMIPISKRFVLMVYLKIESLHYAGRTNPYSNELLKQFEKDLFADFLSHINLEYSPETIAKIQALKNT